MPESRSLFSQKELALLRALVKEQVEFMLVGLSAAALQGAPVVTQDIDLWIKDLSAKNFRAALSDAGVALVPSIGLNPPGLAGEGVGLFDLVLTMSGLYSFDDEKRYVKYIPIGRLTVPVLSIDRILVSKRAAGRKKDLAVLEVLEDTARTLQAKPILEQK